MIADTDLKNDLSFIHIMNVLETKNGLRFVSGSDAKKMDVNRQRFLMPIVPFPYRITPEFRITMRRNNNRFLENLKIKKRYRKSVLPNLNYTGYVDVTDIKPPKKFDEELPTGKTIKEALDKLLLKK